MSDHAILGASSAKRWMNCHGSVGLVLKAPTPEKNEYAQEGTAAHKLGEKALKRFLKTGDRDVSHFAGQKIDGDGKLFKVNADMIEAVQVYVDTVLSYHSDFTEILIEHKFRLDWIAPKLFGTSDTTIYDEDEKHLIVIDYKHGAGLPVEVKKNAQGRYYGLGACEGKEVEKVTIVIVQPRCPHRDGPVRTETISFKELKEWEVNILTPHIKAIHNGSDSLAVGEWCSSCFCPAAGTCPEQAKHAKEICVNDFDDDFLEDDDVEFRSPDALTDEQIAKVMGGMAYMRKWLTKVEEYATLKADGGEPIDGLKLVAGKGSRSWDDEEAARRYFSRTFGVNECHHDRKLLSVAQIEEKFGKDATRGLKIHSIRSEGKPKLVPESDKRPMLVSSAITDFDDDWNDDGLIEL